MPAARTHRHDAQLGVRVCSTRRRPVPPRAGSFIRATTINERGHHGWTNNGGIPGEDAGGSGRRAHLGRDGRQPERAVVQPRPDGLDPLDAHAARGKRGIRGRRGRRVERASRRVRRQLRAGQPAPDQRPVRLPSQPPAGARDRGAHSVDRDRPRLLPGDAPAGVVPRVQPFRGTRNQRVAVSARARARCAPRSRSAASR